MKNKYLKVIIILTSIFYMSGIAGAYTQDELNWKDIVEGTIKYNEYLIGIYGDIEYQVKAIDFPPPVKGIRNTSGNIVPETPAVPSVMLALYKNTRNGSYLIDQFALGKNDFKIINDEVKIIVKDLPAPDSAVWIYESYAPWADVDIQMVDMPNFEIEINMDKTTFGYNDDYAEMGIKINNTGANAKNIYVLIDTEGLQLIKGQSRQTYSFIKNNSVTDISAGIEIPKILQGTKSYNISVVVSGYDIRGKWFTNSSSIKIIAGSDIGPLEVVNFSKATKDRAYIGDNILVSLTLQNNGEFNIDSIVVEDSANNTGANNFRLLGNASLKWYSTVYSGKAWTVDYMLRPLEPGSYTLPAANARISIYGIPYEIKSNTPTIDVYGSRISLAKLASFKDGILSVNLILRNNGNIPTTVGIEDKIVGNYTLVSGNLVKTMFINPSEEKSMSYQARLDKFDNSPLPAAVAYYTIGGYKESAMSNAPSAISAISNEVTSRETPRKPSSLTSADWEEKNVTEPVEVNQINKLDGKSITDTMLSKLPDMSKILESQYTNVIAITLIMISVTGFYILRLKKK